MAYIVEREFKHAGYKCVVVFGDNGYRCGYVGVPKGSRLYGKSYTDKLEDVKIKDMIGKKVGKRGVFSIVMFHSYSREEMCSIDLYFDVHGSLTYSGGGKNSDYPIKSDLWWFGFDCYHAGDKKDYIRTMKLFPQEKKRCKDLMRIDREVYGKSGNTHDVIRTKKYVVKECKRLAEQIREYEGR